MHIPLIVQDVALAIPSQLGAWLGKRWRVGHRENDIRQDTVQNVTVVLALAAVGLVWWPAWVVAAVVGLVKIKNTFRHFWPRR